MQHCNDLVKAYEGLTPQGKLDFLTNLKNSESKDTIKALLITCARSGAWDLLSEAIRISSVRSLLWSVIDDLLVFANHNHSLNQLYACLPVRFSAKEGRLALVFPSTVKSAEIAGEMIRRSAKPGKETFLRAFSSYKSIGESPYEYLIITSAMKWSGFPWHEYLTFPSSSSHGDLLKRSLTSSKPGYTLCAITLMRPEQKAEYVTNLVEAGDPAKIYLHMDLKGKWFKKLPANVKSKILSDQIGI